MYDAGLSPAALAPHRIFLTPILSSAPLSVSAAAGCTGQVCLCFPGGKPSALVGPGGAVSSGRCAGLGSRCAGLSSAPRSSPNLGEALASSSLRWNSNDPPLTPSSLVI